MSNVFEKIIDGEMPSDKVFENERILAIKDLHPVAPVHLLIMPKKRGIQSVQQVSKEDAALMGEVISVAQQLAKEFGVEDSYRLLTNVGSKSGQTIFHLHFHLIGGRSLGAMA